MTKTYVRVNTFFSSDRKVIKQQIKKMEQHWNSVRIKFNLTNEAADKLKKLVDNDDDALRDLGILAVQIDNDKAVKLSLPSKDKQADLIKRNDTLTRLLERTSPPTTTNLPFIVNNKRLDSLVVQSSAQQQTHHHQNVVQPSTSQQQNDIVDRQLAYLNATNLKLPNTKTTDNSLARPIQINSSGIGPSSICNNNNNLVTTSVNQLMNQSPLNKNIQTFTYVNMQPSINQQQQQPPQMNQMSSQIGNQMSNQMSNPINQTPMSQLNNQLNKPSIGDSNLTINKANNLITLNNKINLSPIHQTSLPSAIPTQNVVQQIQLKYPSQPLNSTAAAVVTSNQTNLIGNNIVSIKQPYVRNPNIKMNNQISLNATVNQPINQPINQSISQLNNNNQLNQPLTPQPQPSLNSQLPNQTNSSNASNVALTSPLLVNLLQSDVNDHYNSSNSTHLSSSLSNTLSNSNNSTIKEPPAKKTKTKKTRKPKDKPPDQLNNSTGKQQPIQQQQLNHNVRTSPKNELTNNPTATVNTSPSNIHPQYQYSNTIVNSSIITIPASLR